MCLILNIGKGTYSPLGCLKDSHSPRLSLLRTSQAKGQISPHSSQAFMPVMCQVSASFPLSLRSQASVTSLDRTVSQRITYPVFFERSRKPSMCVTPNDKAWKLSPSCDSAVPLHNVISSHSKDITGGSRQRELLTQSPLCHPSLSVHKFPHNPEHPCMLDSTLGSLRV